MEMLQQFSVTGKHEETTSDTNQRLSNMLGLHENGMQTKLML